jgi:hypothetical protein
MTHLSEGTRRRAVRDVRDGLARASKGWFLASKCRVCSSRSMGFEDAVAAPGLSRYLLTHPGIPKSCRITGTTRPEPRPLRLLSNVDQGRGKQSEKYSSTENLQSGDTLPREGKRRSERQRINLDLAPIPSTAKHCVVSTSQTPGRALRFLTTKE